MGTELFEHELQHFYAFQHKGVPAKFVMLVGKKNEVAHYFITAVLPQYPDDMPEEEKKAALLFAAQAVDFKGSDDQMTIKSNS